MKTAKALEKYLEDITGQMPVIKGTASDVALPLYLKAVYALKSVSLFHRPVVLAIQKDEMALMKPSEYAGHLGQLEKIITDPVVLVLPQMSSYTRNRLVRQGVSFVVPGRQLFIPELGVDLREYYARTGRRAAETLSASSQLVLLFYLNGHDLQGLSLSSLAHSLGYTPMTLSNVRDELEAQGLCKVVQQGRSRHLKFEATRRALWEQVKDLLQTPVRDTQWIRWDTPLLHAYAAGLSALARYSTLNEDPLPVYAMRDCEYRKALKKEAFRVCEGAEDANARMESWSYDPAVLAENQIVDRLSLYLSLRPSVDERVQKAMDEMLEDVSW